MALLLDGIGSSSLRVTEVVFVSTPLVSLGTSTVTLTTVHPPAGAVPRSQVTTPAASVQVGAPGTEPANTTPSGKVLLRVTPVASRVPLFTTLRK